MYDDIRSRLRDAESTIRKVREERNRAGEVYKSARKAAEETETDATLDAALAAKKALAEIDEQIGTATDDQVALLKRLGDVETGVAGFATGLTDGWEQAARTLSLAEGNLRADVPAAALLLQAAPAAPSFGGAAPSGGGEPRRIAGCSRRCRTHRLAERRTSSRPTTPSSSSSRS